MADDSETSPLLSSLLSQPITDDAVKQIGESDNPKIRGAMGVSGIDTRCNRSVPVGYGSEDARHRLRSSRRTMAGLRFLRNGRDEPRYEVVERANEIANEWFAEGLSDRIAASEPTDRDT